MISIDLLAVSEPGRAEIICRRVDALSALLMEHLLLEDDFLYLALRKRNQREVRETAHLFAIELGGVKRAFFEYINRWPTAERITSNHDGFLSESNAVLTALCHRIEKEDNEIFPLLDACNN